MTRPDIPQEFKDYTRCLLGAERYARFAQALDEPPSVSVRLNPFKAVWSGLSAEGLNGGDGPVLWASGEGCYLSERLRSRSTRCFMPVPIMYKRRLPCFWGKSYAVM